jgi:SAM-dependent methyltransferase
MGAPESDRVFAGSVPAIYEEKFVPILFDPYARELVGRLAAVEHGSILEIAAGTGVVTRYLADQLPPTVTITATDLNQGMLDRAAMVGTSRPVEWRQADALALPFADGSFDVVVCQFGVMFFEPKHEAFAEMRRVLRPAGRLLFNVWGSLEDNDFANVVNRAVNDVRPAEPVNFFERTPHGYHDRETIVADLHAGGFVAEPTIERVQLRSRAASAHDVAIAFCQGTPLRAELDRRGPGRLAEATSAAADAVTARFGLGPVEARISALVVEDLAP